MQLLESFLGSCFSERKAPQAGQTGLLVSVDAGVDFAFFSGLGSFEIFGEGSGRGVDLSLSLPILSFVFTLIVNFSRFLVLVLRFMQDLIV